MEFYNNRPELDSYVAKYMDENGCSFEQACKELEIKYPDAFMSLNEEETD